ncbi:MAG: twin-arginine translocase subunit TatC, partial [Proteobacteria bacterium]|nr:twin-arginine translocase subunit TatC [Pseudomonadota bacterium]
NNFSQHLIELRKCLLKSFLVLIILFLILSFFSKEIFEYLALPVLKSLPQGHSLIATGVISPFFVPFKLAFALAFFLSVPYVLYQLWRFAVPGLYRHEKRTGWLLLISSVVLFYSGVLFAYFAALPMLFHFMTSVAPPGVLVMPDISQYLDFTLRLFFAFGLSFEVPVIVVLLISMALTTREQLIQWRPYVIVGAFVVAMLLAPPDVMSQILLAIPLWLLFEAGIFVSKFMPNMMDKQE